MNAGAAVVDDFGDGLFLRLPARLRLTRLVGVLAPELATELELDDTPGRSNRLIKSFWVAETRRTTGRSPEMLSGIFDRFFVQFGTSFKRFVVFYFMREIVEQ